MYRSCPRAGVSLEVWLNRSIRAWRVPGALERRYSTAASTLQLHSVDSSGPPRQSKRVPYSHLERNVSAARCVLKEGMPRHGLPCGVGILVGNGMASGDHLVVNLASSWKMEARAHPVASLCRLCQSHAIDIGCQTRCDDREFDVHQESRRSDGRGTLRNRLSGQETTVYGASSSIFSPRP